MPHTFAGHAGTRQRNPHVHAPLRLHQRAQAPAARGDPPVGHEPHHRRQRPPAHHQGRLNPSARVQIYFIDNDDYFARKAILHDEEGLPFADNDERALFFARGVLETVKKLRWSPTVVHCHGWFAGIVPLYLRKVFADDPIFRDVKIVVSLYDDAFPGTLDGGFRKKIENEGIRDKNMSVLDTPSYENLCRFVISYADGVVAASENAAPEILAFARESGKPVLEYRSPEAEDFFDNYNRFYEDLQ